MAEYDSELTRLVEQVNRSDKGPTADETKLLVQFLTVAVQRGASDLLLVAGSPAIFRVNGALSSGVGQTLSPAELRSIVLPILDPPQHEELQERRSIDLSGVHLPPQFACGLNEFPLLSPFTCRRASLFWQNAGRV